MRIARRTAVALLRRVPQAWRFRLAILVARTLERTVAGTESMREERPAYRRVNSPRETALGIVLKIMQHHGVAYDPELHIEGRDHLESALRSKRGVLFAGVHTSLNLLVVRHLSDRDLAPLLIADTEDAPLWGALEAAKVIQPSPTFLMRVRSVLRSGGIVCADIDRDSDSNGRCVEIMTVAGPVLIAYPLLRVALSSGAEIVFTTTRVEPGVGVVASFGGPSTGARTEETVLRDFARWVQDHVESLDPSCAPPAQPERAA